jgi:cell division septation protein DedD
MRYKCLVAVMIAAAAAGPVSAQSVKAGIEAWQKADYSAAVGIWKPLADKGDADAAFNLGQAYRLGRGVRQDYAAAQGWFEIAARKGHVDAQATLGLMLFQTGNQAGGLRWLKKAALSGEPRAMLVYGTAMFNGDGMPRDPLLGYRLVMGAAEQGLEPARMTLQRLDEVLPADQREKALQLALPTDEAPAPVAKATKKTASKKSVEIAAAAAPTPKPEPKKAAAEPKKTPVAEAKPPARPAPAASGAWRIQLGAFSQKGSAEALYRKVSGNGALAGRKPFYVAAGAVTRLQVGPFESSAAAQTACNALKQACFPVAAK